MLWDEADQAQIGGFLLENGAEFNFLGENRTP